MEVNAGLYNSLHITGYIIQIINYGLQVTLNMLHVTGYILYVACYMLHYTYYRLQVTCCMLYATCYKCDYGLRAIFKSFQITSYIL